MELDENEKFLYEHVYSEEQRIKADKELKLVTNFNDNISPLYLIKNWEKMQIDDGMEIPEAIAKLQSKINLTAEEQWQTMNELLSIDDPILPETIEKIGFLKRVRESVMQRMALEGELINTEYMTDNEKVSMLISLDYVRQVSKNGKLTDIEGCLKADINAERIIKSMSSPESKRNALKTARIFDTTREKIEQEIQKYKSDTHISGRDIAEASKDTEMASSEVKKGKQVVNMLRGLFQKKR